MIYFCFFATFATILTLTRKVCLTKAEHILLSMEFISATNNKEFTQNTSFIFYNNQSNRKIYLLILFSLLFLKKLPKFSGHSLWRVKKRVRQIYLKSVWKKTSAKLDACSSCTAWEFFWLVKTAFWGILRLHLYQFSLINFCVNKQAINKQLNVINKTER